MRQARSCSRSVGCFPGVQPIQWPSGSNTSPRAIPSLNPGPGSRSSRRRAIPFGSSSMRAWCTICGFPGRNSNPRTKRVRSIGIGRANLRNTSGPSAGMAKGSGISRIRSGWPRLQPDDHVGSAGRSSALPPGRPLSIHASMVAISLSGIDRSPSNLAIPGVGGQGGM